ncbi:MAG: 30S ribosomal protein S3 [Candidatus Shikimatogenerans bostrichidophilus]|nr:MAG: 30S ribosomal protein S3 [Candidatus Shikimatogenerans bostrichidophilus]
MGQKSNPIANRLGFIYGWKSIWVNNYFLNVIEDNKIRDYINNRFQNKYCISSILIERTRNKIIITICTSRPAIVIGKKGKEVDFIKRKIKEIIIDNIKNNNFLKKNIKYNNMDVYINVVDIINPEIDSLLVAKNICRQIKYRISYKRSIKFSILTAIKMKITGIKIQISGRLNGVEMARTETYKKGSIKLSTFRSNIDYALNEVNTTYGKIGVKVWIMKGEIYKNNKDLSNFYKNFFYKNKNYKKNKFKPKKFKPNKFKPNKFKQNKF